MRTAESPNQTEASPNTGASTSRAISSAANGVPARGSGRWSIHTSANASIWSAMPSDETRSRFTPALPPRARRKTKNTVNQAQPAATMIRETSGSNAAS